MSYPGGYVLRRRTIRVIAAVAISLSLFALSEARAASSVFISPVFGMVMEAGKANYPPLAPDIAKRCNLTGAKYLVFAHIKDKAGDAYIVQEAPGAQPATPGVAMRVSPAGCTVADAAWTLSGIASGTYTVAAATTPALPGDQAEKVCESGTCHYVLRSAAEEQMLKALLDDAVLKGQQASGGSAAFNAKACEPAVIRNAEDYPAVHARLARLCGI